jgi:hypothetical protein
MPLEPLEILLHELRELREEDRTGDAQDSVEEPLGALGRGS